MQVVAHGERLTPSTIPRHAARFNVLNRHVDLDTVMVLGNIGSPQPDTNSGLCRCQRSHRESGLVRCAWPRSPAEDSTVCKAWRLGASGSHHRHHPTGAGHDHARADLCIAARSLACAQ
jgi:hypothetical protein